MDESGIKIFQADDGKTEIQVVVQDDTVWLSQMQSQQNRAFQKICKKLYFFLKIA